MNQFILKNGCSELLPFRHIVEFAVKKNSTIRFNSLKTAALDTLRLYYIINGKFEWIIENRHYIVYPGDLAVILPGQLLGGEKDFLDIGTVTWLHVQIEKPRHGKNTRFGKWSSLSAQETAAIQQLLQHNAKAVLSKANEAGVLFSKIQHEVFKREIGYATRVNQLIDELLILIARRLSHQNNSRRGFPKSFVKLESSLRKNLSHQWTVKEMAALAGLGTTVFSEQIKTYTGFSPLNFLINIRLSEAKKLLKRPATHVTDIALDTGFYSSQHFSTTFKKLTGYSPSEFRNISKRKGP